MHGWSGPTGRRAGVPEMVVELLGGIGIFLLGMVLMTEGLRALAGRSLRRALARFTGNRFAAVATGALATTLVQSSSATSMTTIGLVAAGLLPAVNGIGVILGANLGTTSTAWIVAYFGLKLDLSAIAMVAVVTGAALRLLGRDRLASIGLPLAGFGLLFVGIDTMQAAMASLAEGFTLPATAGSSLGGQLLLVLAGALMTILMQASGAAVAATLTALSVGAIGLEQAAALVIGQNIGTTPKSLLASLGATVAARRTAMAHVVFNVGTAVVALAVLPAFIWIARAVIGPNDDGTLTLALFHTLFNLVGITLVLPWIGSFGRLIARIVPERGPVIARYLNTASAAEPPVAVIAARTTLLMCATEISDETRLLATEATAAREIAAARLRLKRVGDALEETKTFLAPIETDPSDEASHKRHVSVLHALDHLRGTVTLLEDAAALERLRHDPELGELRSALHDALQATLAWCPVHAPEAPADHVLDALAAIPPLRRRTKRRLLRLVAASDVDADDAEVTLEAVAWTQAFSHHLLRAVHHLREPAPGDEA